MEARGVLEGPTQDVPIPANHFNFLMPHKKSSIPGLLIHRFGISGRGNVPVNSIFTISSFGNVNILLLLSLNFLHTVGENNSAFPSSFPFFSSEVDDPGSPLFS